MIKRRWLKQTAAIGMCITMAAGVLSGCGEGGSTNDIGKSKTSKSEDVESAKDIGEKPTIKILCSSEIEADEFSKMEEALEKFADKAPNVELDCEFIPFAEIDNKLFLTNAGGNYYDVILVNNSTLPALVDAGVLDDVSDLMDRDGINIDENFTSAMAQCMQYNDGVYAVPFQTDTRVMAVNEKILESVGMDIPETKEDMLEIAKAVSEKGNGDQYGYLMNISRSLPCVYIQGQWLLSNGLHLYELEDDGQMVSKLNSDAGKDFFQWAADMGKYSPNDLISYDNAMIDNAFASGKTALYTFLPNKLTQVDFVKTLEETGTEYKLILNPSGLTGTNAAVSGGWLWGISPKSENREAAWEFINFYTDPEVNAFLCSGLPPVNDAYNYAPFNGPEYEVLKEQLKTSEMAVGTFTPEFNDLVDAYGQNLIAAILGEKDVDRAVENAEDQVNEILKEGGYQN